jgi:hypothetical protein
MAHSTTVPAASNKPATHTDWYTFLRSALIDGLKAYGASLMVVQREEVGAPSKPRSLRLGWETTNLDLQGTGCPIHRAVSSRDGWETMNSYADAGFLTAPLSPAGSRA